MMEREEEVLGRRLTIMSFVLAGRYYARVYDAELNRELSRGEGTCREAAEEQALEIAGQRLNHFRSPADEPRGR